MAVGRHRAQKPSLNLIWDSLWVFPALFWSVTILGALLVWLLK